MSGSNPRMQTSLEPKISDIKFPRKVLCPHSALKHSAGLSLTMYLNGSTNYPTTVKRKPCSILPIYRIPIYSTHFPVQILNNLSPNQSQRLYLLASISPVH